MNITPKKLEKTKELLELLNDYHNYLDMFDSNTYEKLSDLANKLEKELDWELSYLEKEIEANKIKQVIKDKGFNTDKIEVYTI